MAAPSSTVTSPPTGSPDNAEVSASRHVQSGVLSYLVAAGDVGHCLQTLLSREAVASHKTEELAVFPRIFGEDMANMCARLATAHS